jgi:hypothetical protein
MKANNFKKEYKNGARFAVFAGPKNTEDIYILTGPTKPTRSDVKNIRAGLAKSLKTTTRKIELNIYPILPDGALQIPHCLHESVA